MNPDDPVITQLRDLARRIEEKRVELDISNAEWCKRFAQLGSTKTYRRICDLADDLEGMDTNSQLVRYCGAWEQVKGFIPRADQIYGDFDFVKLGVATVVEAMNGPDGDNTRVVLVTADTGGGKSAFGEHLLANPLTGRASYRVEANETWRKSPKNILSAILGEVVIARSANAAKDDGEAGGGTCAHIFPHSSADCLEALIRKIGERRLILIIDESHHIGPDGLNLIKTLINRCPRLVVVLLAIAILIHRVAQMNHAEAVQLFKNRLFRHIRIATPAPSDILTFMDRCGVAFTTPKDANDIAQRIAADAPACGLWKYVRRCQREASRLMLKNTVKTIDAAAFHTVIAKVKGQLILGA